MHRVYRVRNRHDPLFVTSAQISRAQRWPIGTLVSVTKDDGSIVETETRTAPYKGVRTWWIGVEMQSSGYSACPLAWVQERAAVA